jgi:hypothetical protein
MSYSACEPYATVIGRAAQVTLLLLVGAVLVASIWHPLGGDSRSAASASGLRLLMMFLLVVAGLFVPQWFDRGNLDGTSTCPSFISNDSSAWWVETFILALTWWAGTGVFKASAKSFIRNEGYSLAMLLAVASALGLGLVAAFLNAFSGFCP